MVDFCFANTLYLVVFSSIVVIDKSAVCSFSSQSAVRHGVLSVATDEFRISRINSLTI